MPPTLVDPNPEAGFHYPYFLRVPEDPGPETILVEPTCSAHPSDNFDDHLQQAEERATRATGRTIADELRIPFVHPVFPRPVSDPVDWTHYIHSLDAETLRITDPPLNRVDLQLLSMFDDARERLADHGYHTGEKFLLNGFSASGTFVNRFAALHPERVLSVTAGGLNGMAVLPVMQPTDLPLEIPSEFVSRLDCLPYPVGVGDLVELIDAPFDLEAFREVNQFLYLGGQDTNDSLLYPDAWTGINARAAAILVYGEDIHNERFPRCETVYDELGIPAIFQTYAEADHTPLPAVNDIIEFHSRTLSGEPIEDIRVAIDSNQR